MISGYIFKGESTIVAIELDTKWERNMSKVIANFLEG